MPSIEINNGKVFINGKEIAQHCSSCDQAKDSDVCISRKDRNGNKLICFIQIASLIGWIYALCSMNIQHPIIGTLLVLILVSGIDRCELFEW